jgi:hypothetical protein
MTVLDFGLPDALLEAEPAVLEAIPRLPDGWAWAGAYAICNERRDHVAKLLSNGVPGYLAWLCVGRGQGFRGADVGRFVRGCWPTAREAMRALEVARDEWEREGMT